MAKTNLPLWQQFELRYVHRLSDFRKWKRWLSVGCAALGGAWVVASVVRNDPTPYSSGPISTAHAQLGDKCFHCHTKPWDGWTSTIAPQQATRDMNSACLNCHASTIAYDSKTTAAVHENYGDREARAAEIAACDDCHREHRGSSSLAVVADDRCTSCHADLTTQKPDAQYAHEISAFWVDHPEFAAMRADARPDHTRIKFNHALHLKKDHRGPRGVVRMTCDNCHRSGPSSEPWPFGRPPLHAEGANAPPQSSYQLAGSFMNPIRYSLHCQSCHELVVDPAGERRWDGGTVPHDEPQRIRTYLRGQLAAFIHENPSELVRDTSDSPNARPSRRAPAPAEVDRRSFDWMDAQLSLYETKIYSDRKTCLFCHDQVNRDGNDGLPTILPPQMPSRWFLHSSFNHARHRVWDCLLCHKEAETSTKTSQILLPGIETCRMCHAPTNESGSAETAGAAHQCTTCHTYHRLPAAANKQPGRRLSDLVSFPLREESASPRP